MLGFTIFLTAYVPLICWASPSEVFCNSPSGYELYAVAGDGTRRLVDREPGPTHKPLVVELREGEQTLVLVAGG